MTIEQFSPRERTKELIEQGAQEHNIEIGEPERQFIEELLETIPQKKLTLSSLDQWCNGAVLKGITRHPELEDKAEVIKTYVREKLRQELIQEYLDKTPKGMSQILKREQPKTFNEHWMRNYNPRLVNFLRNHDLWPEFLARLDPKWQGRFI